MLRRKLKRSSLFRSSAKRFRDSCLQKRLATIINIEGDAGVGELALAGQATLEEVVEAASRMKYFATRGQDQVKQEEMETADLPGQYAEQVASTTKRRRGGVRKQMCNKQEVSAPQRQDQSARVRANIARVRAKMARQNRRGGGAGRDPCHQDGTEKAAAIPK